MTLTSTIWRLWIKLALVSAAMVSSACAHQSAVAECLRPNDQVVDQREVALMTAEPVSSFYYRSDDFLLFVDVKDVKSSLHSMIDKYGVTYDKRLMARLNEVDTRARYSDLLAPALSDPSLLPRIQLLLINLLEANKAAVAKLYAFPDDDDRFHERVVVYDFARGASTGRGVCTMAGELILRLVETISN